MRTRGVAGDPCVRAPRVRLCALALFSLLGCNAYDAALLAKGSALGGSEDASTRASASGGAAPLTRTPCTKADANDGCCPAGMGPAQDSDCGRCGDGLIGAGETCDPPESCPTAKECKLASGCVVAEFTGDPARCNARCEVKPIRACVGGDGCCPTTCSHESDRDCSGACGDGVVDATIGETCEPTSREMACPTSCDDGNACTQDLATGSATTCSASCSHVRITAPAHDDGCCPPGAHALNDSDCAPRCGNGVVEPGEDCDGGTDCTATCTMPTEQQRCVAVLGEGDCAACACSKCAAPMLHCYQSGNPERDARCEPVVECALQARCIGACSQDDPTGCFGQYCWCGTATCPPNGPCRGEIAAAAQSVVSATIAARARDPQYPLYDAEQYGACIRTNCATQCGLY